jgi:hypothetical protein
VALASRLKAAPTRRTFQECSPDGQLGKLERARAEMGKTYSDAMGRQMAILKRIKGLTGDRQVSTDVLRAMLRDDAKAPPYVRLKSFCEGGGVESLDRFTSRPASSFAYHKWPLFWFFSVHVDGCTAKWSRRQFAADAVTAAATAWNGRFVARRYPSKSRNSGLRSMTSRTNQHSGTTLRLRRRTSLRAPRTKRYP